MNCLEYAKAENIEICSQIIEEGKRFQRQQGFVQWTDDYPNRETISEDIKKRKGMSFDPTVKSPDICVLIFPVNPLMKESRANGVPTGNTP